VSDPEGRARVPSLGSRLGLGLFYTRDPRDPDPARSASRSVYELHST